MRFLLSDGMAVMRTAWAHRPTTVGVLLLLYMLVSTGSAAAAACDPSTNVCVNIDWLTGALDWIAKKIGNVAVDVGILIAVGSLFYIRAKGGWEKGLIGVATGIMIAVIAANIEAGGIQHKILNG